MEVDDIISYHDLVTAEKASLQKGMNYRVRKDYSVFLMSLRENAPYADALDPITGILTYEGHDEPQRKGGPNPKDVLRSRRESWANTAMFLLDDYFPDEAFVCEECSDPDEAQRIANYYRRIIMK